MKLGHIEIFVKNPLESKNFYVDVLGFELETIQNDKFVWLKSGGNIILLRPGENPNKSQNYQNTNSALVLYTDNLYKTTSELKAKGLNFKGTDGSERCLTFTDPDGNWFQLVNPSEH